jgi:SnoaL-like polyketide cyclase
MPPSHGSKPLKATAWLVEREVAKAARALPSTSLREQDIAECEPTCRCSQNSSIEPFPDGRFEIHEVIAAHPKYTVRTTAHGTHKAAFLGKDATGKAISFDTIDIHEVEGDTIRRSWHIEDFAAFFRQIEG